ncbi:hypothetical protein D3C86_1747490 [compost metagenome]
MYMNIGAPIRAVMIPIGSSTFGTIVRAITSVQIRKMAPNRMDAGSSLRWSEPTRPLTKWGMIRPTNPIIPQLATMMPVISAVMII